MSGYSSYLEIKNSLYIHPVSLSTKKSGQTYPITVDDSLVAGRYISYTFVPIENYSFNLFINFL